MLLKNSMILFLSRKFLIILFFLLLTFSSIYSQGSNFVSKKGGICFRTDDDQSISKYLDYASLFKKYNQNFCPAINLSMDEITPEDINSLKEIQADGNEIMDHTPWHRTNYFFTNLPTDYYINNPGVQRIAGNKVDLKFSSVNIDDAKRTGYVNIKNDTVISESGIFSSFSKSDCYLYFPSLNQLVFIDESFGWIDQNKVKIMDVWRDSIDLGIHQNVQFYNFDFNNVHLSVDGLKALAEESIRLTEYYGLDKSLTWIQPGGYFPHVYGNELRQAIEELGYKAAGSYPNPSLKVFNEYNPNNDAQFAMSWGDFQETIWTLEQCKQYIADKIAKHHVLIGENHFTYLGDGSKIDWQSFLYKVEGLLQWCVTKNISIKTYSQWADILYNQTPDPFENIIPPLNVDLDENSIPDGYEQSGQGVLIKSDGIPSANDYCYSINKAGQICSITGLGGVEKGNNEFEIWTKGAPGNFIEVTFKVGSQNLVYKFPAENPGWKQYKLSQSINDNTSLNIPANVSLIDITINCSNYSSGSVKISGMKLSKSLETNDYLTLIPASQNVSYSEGSNSFEIKSNINWTVNDDADWLTVTPPNGSGDGTLTVFYSDNTVANERVGTITIDGSGITKAITITQQAAPFKLNVEPEEFNVMYLAGSAKFSVESNTNWTIDSDVDWLSVSPENGSYNDSITINYIANPNTTPRIGNLTIRGGDLTKTIAITQQAAPFELYVEPEEFNVMYLAGSAKFSVESNTNWTIDSDVDWLSVSPENGSYNDSITINYIANPNTTPRIGNLTIRGGDLTKTIKVQQNAKKFLIAAPIDTVIPADSGVFNLIIISNLDWELKEDLDWIHLNKYYGSNSDTVIVSYDSNKEITSREGSVLIYYGGDSTKVSLYQNASSYLFIAPDSEIVNADSGKIKIIIESNISWHIINEY